MQYKIPYLLLQSICSNLFFRFWNFLFKSFLSFQFRLSYLCAWPACVRTYTHLFFTEARPALIHMGPANHMKTVMKMMTLNPAPLFFMVKVWKLRNFLLPQFFGEHFVLKPILCALTYNGPHASTILLVPGIRLLAPNTSLLKDCSCSPSQSQFLIVCTDMENSFLFFRITPL